MTITTIEPIHTELSEIEQEMLLHTVILARREAEVTVTMDLGCAEEYASDLLGAYQEARQCWSNADNVPDGAIAWRMTYEIGVAFDALVDAELMDDEDAVQLENVPAMPKDPSSAYSSMGKFLNLTTSLARRAAEVGVAMDQGEDDLYRDDLLDTRKKALLWLKKDAAAFPASMVDFLKGELHEASFILGLNE